MSQLILLISFLIHVHSVPTVFVVCSVTKVMLSCGVSYTVLTMTLFLRSKAALGKDVVMISSL